MQLEYDIENVDADLASDVQEKLRAFMQQKRVVLEFVACSFAPGKLYVELDERTKPERLEALLPYIDSVVRNARDAHRPRTMENRSLKRQLPDYPRPPLAKTE